MSPTPADVARRIAPRPPEPAPVDPNAEWIRCPCGKIVSETRAEAERKAKVAAERHHRVCPVRFYMCEEGSWHWSEKFTAVLDCDCGHRAYVDEISAAKSARRRTNRLIGNDRGTIEAVTYQCENGQWHVILYPVGSLFLVCQCGAIAYRTMDAAQTMLHFLNHPNRPGADLPDYVAYECPTTGHLEITRPDRVPAGAPIHQESR